MLDRLSDTKAWMLAVLRWHAYSIGQMQILYTRPLHTAMSAILYWYAPVRSKRPVGEKLHSHKRLVGEKLHSQKQTKIRMVRKSEPEIEPVRKRTIPFLYEQKGQGQFRSTFLTCWVSTGTCKCISVTLSQYIRETLFSCRSQCQCFFYF